MIAAGTQGRRLLEHAATVARERDEKIGEKADARLGWTLSRAHDSINAADPDLRALLAAGLSEPWLASQAEAALSRLDWIRERLHSSTDVRDAFTDSSGQLPLMGGYAPQLDSQKTSPLKRYYGNLETLPRSIPVGLRGVARQVGLVLDEVRALHTADIERSVLLFTLFSRAVLVPLAPLLGSWTSAPTPLSGTSLVADLAWGLAAVVSLGTVFAAPGLVDRVMEDTEAGRATRRLLLRVEVPVLLVVLPLQPAWTVVVFASGWTNWWQRQTKGLEFDWRKLGVFVATTSFLQCTGLAHAEVAIGEAVGDVCAALLAIAVTGGSYGAMLPLSVATVLGVLIGDGRRSLRTMRLARAELLDCAHELEQTAILIHAAAPETPVATRAADTARRAARQLESAADRAGRRGLFASQVLAELAAESVAGSYLWRRDSPKLRRAEQAAREAGEPAPAYATSAIFGSPVGLGAARVATQRHAAIVREIIERALNEASTHGTKGVRVLLLIRAGRLVVRVGNRPRPEARGPGSGEGARDLRRLAAKLPGGALERGPRPAADIGMPEGSEWWVVELSCDLKLLENPLQYSPTA